MTKMQKQDDEFDSAIHACLFGIVVADILLLVATLLGWFS